MPKIAIVGLGWLGLPAALALKNDGHAVCGTCTSVEKQIVLQEQGVDNIVLDAALSNQLQAKDFFKECTHGLLNIPPSKISAESYEEACLSLIQLFPENCKIIFASSTGVYLDNSKTLRETEIKDEDFVANHPVRATELALQNVLGKRLSIIRFAGLIGPNRNPAKYFAGKRQIPNGLAPVNLIQLEDCITVIRALIERDFFGHILHACADEHPSKMDYYTRQCAELGLDLPEFIAEKQNWKIIDNCWTKTQLGIHFKHSF